jgi:hypothetical protein
MNLNDDQNARGKNNRTLGRKNDKCTVMTLFSSLRQDLIEMYAYIGT